MANLVDAGYSRPHLKSDGSLDLDRTLGHHGRDEPGPSAVSDPAIDVLRRAGLCKHDRAPRGRASMKRDLLVAAGPESLRTSIFNSGLGRCIREIQTALETYLEDLNRSVIQKVERLGWNGVALYLVDSAGTALEAAAATDATVPGIIRHRLPAASEQREELARLGIFDIEVCTFLSMRAERIAGGKRDPRYNSYVYHSLGHRRFVDRLFIPLLLVRDKQDYSLHQEACRWTRDGTTWTPNAGNYQRQVIGTLSVSSLEHVSDEVVEHTLAFATQIASVVAYRASFHGMCESLLSQIVRASRAHAASLHFTHDTSTEFSQWNPCLSFERGRGVVLQRAEHGKLGARPRPDGIGADALRQELPMRYSEDELERRAPELFGDGIRTTDVFPVIGGEGRTVGLLYLHHRDIQRTPISAELFDIVTFASCAFDVALRVDMRMNLVRERAVAEALRFTGTGREDLGTRVGAMASYAWSLLGCDHVSIAVGGPGSHLKGKRAAESAGRYLEPQQAQRSLKQCLCAIAVPERAQYLSRGTYDQSTLRDDFVLRERVEATAVLPLRAKGPGGEVVVGVMIVDYRGSHEFADGQKSVLERLASFFAAGILMLDEPEYRSQVLQQVASLQQETSFLRTLICPLSYSA